MAGWPDNAEAGGPAVDWRRDPLIRVALAMAAGVVLGAAAAVPIAWLGAGAVALAVVMVMLFRRRDRGVRAWSAVAVVCLSAAWGAVRDGWVAADSVARFVQTEPQLAEVTGVIDSAPWLRRTHDGPFATYSWEPPATLFVMEVEGIGIAAAREAASGRLLVRIDEAEHRLRLGQRVRVTGWLAAVQGPMNPGEFDYRAAMLERGIEGRLTMPSRANCEVIGTAPALAAPLRAFHAARAEVSAAAMWSLGLGLEEWPRERGLLQTLLLGVWSHELKDVEDEFRAVGLTHVLCISGAHLAILMWIVWQLVRLVVPDPPRAAAIVLAVLVAYLLAIPMNVPIARAAIMATLLCLGGMSGRRTTALQVLALSCVVCLAWRPMDLFAPGFQLSFGIVWALLVFTRPVAEWVWPAPLVRVTAPTFGELAGRKFVEFMAASVVAFVVALPLVAYHFGIISPLAVLLSVLSFLPVSGLLFFGYLKILLGLVVPSASIVMAGPLAWLADVLVSLVEHAARWPGASVELGAPPTLGWTLAAVLAVVAALAGWFAGRRRAMACTGVVLGVWLAAVQPGSGGGRFAWALPWSGEAPVATVTMFAVGDGSCFVVELPGDGAAEPHVLMFDCGSSGYLDVGARSIVPSLRGLGVGRIDTLVLSHADLDHFSGVLDVAARVPVGRVLMPPQMLVEARAKPQAAPGYLLAELEARGLRIEVVAGGWREEVASAELNVLWPPTELKPKRNNDGSIALLIRVGDRRILLNGDIGDEAMFALLHDRVELRADVADLPHHGSFVDSSPRWLAAVAPRVVLQSSGPARLRRDRWAEVVGAQGAERWVTARHGMVRVRLYADGRIESEPFRP